MPTHICSRCGNKTSMTCRTAERITGGELVRKCKKCGQRIGEPEKKGG